MTSWVRKKGLRFLRDTFMSKRRVLKLIHIGGTGWFILCVGYILVLALRQAGFCWRVIFPLSGYLALIVLLLISLYLFAVFRGVARNRKTKIERNILTIWSSKFCQFWQVTGLDIYLQRLFDRIHRIKTTVLERKKTLIRTDCVIAPGLLLLL